MIVMGMMPMMDNSVDEIPVPFMSVEQTTESLNSVQNILPMREERRPTLGTYLSVALHLKLHCTASSILKF